MRKLVIGGLVVVGAFLGLVWWFDVEVTGGSFADFFADPVGGTQSLFSRLQLKVAAMIETLKGASGAAQANPRTLAASLIAGFEGFSAKPYPDPPGQTAKYSIGYGHQIVPGDGFTLDSVTSEGDALAQLEADLDVFASCVDNAVTVPLGPNETAALYSFTYNEGCGAFRGSTLLKRLNEGNYEGADAEFAKWNVANHNILPVLTLRRADEASIFAKDITPTEDTTA